jgi:hypothetical protein
VEPDPKLAVDWSLKAAVSGHVEAAYTLAAIMLGTAKGTKAAAILGGTYSAEDFGHAVDPNAEAWAYGGKWLRNVRALCVQHARCTALEGCAARTALGVRVSVPVGQWAERDGGGCAVLPARLSNADLGTRHLASHLTPVLTLCADCLALAPVADPPGGQGAARAVCGAAGGSHRRRPDRGVKMKMKEVGGGCIAGARSASAPG